MCMYTCMYMCTSPRIHASLAQTVTNDNVEDHTLGVLVVAPDATSVSNMSSRELREALEARGLENTGKKAQLAERLLEALDKDESSKAKKETVAHEVVSNVLVGAEVHEARLEALLHRKRELTGEA